MEKKETAERYLEKCESVFPEILQGLKIFLEYAFNQSTFFELNYLFQKYGHPEGRELDLLRSALFGYLKKYYNDLNFLIGLTDSHPMNVEYSIKEIINILLIMYATLKIEEEMKEKEGKDK
jgi:hypothetical protein